MFFEHALPGFRAIAEKIVEDKRRLNRYNVG